MAMGQNPNRTPSEHPNATTKIGSKMGEKNSPTAKRGTIGFDPATFSEAHFGARGHHFWSLSPACGSRALRSRIFLWSGEKEAKRKKAPPKGGFSTF